MGSREGSLQQPSGQEEPRKGGEGQKRGGKHRSLGYPERSGLIRMENTDQDGKTGEGGDANESENSKRGCWRKLSRAADPLHRKGLAETGPVQPTPAKTTPISNAVSLSSVNTQVPGRAKTFKSRLRSPISSLTCRWPKKTGLYEDVLFVFLFCFVLFVFLGPHPGYMEVPRLGVESELQLPACTTATATRDPSRVCGLHHSSRQRWILNPLSEAND